MEINESKLYHLSTVIEGLNFNFAIEAESPEHAGEKFKKVLEQLLIEVSMQFPKQEPKK